MQMRLMTSATLLVILLSGCGGTVDGVEGERFDEPQVTLTTLVTEPSPLTAAGGRARFDAGIVRRGGTYMVPPADNPTFAVLDSRRREILSGQTLTRTEGNDLGWVVSGEFTVPPGQAGKALTYRIIITVPRLSGKPYREEFVGVTVPGI
jgi:hypothetical protein